MRQLAILPLALMVLAALAACGSGRSPSAAPANGGAVPFRIGATLPPAPPAASPFLHRPPTWQDVRGFTPGVDYHPDEILVLFADELAAGSVHGGAVAGQPAFNAASVLYRNREHAQFARELACKYGLAILESQEAYVPGFNFCGYRLPDAASAEALMQRILDENPLNVRAVEYNPIYHPAYVPDDPLLPTEQWHHDGSHMDDYGAWDTQQGDPGVWVAIIDTGVDMDHPDLVDNILDLLTLWPEEDFDLAEADRWPDDPHGHGTHCAGIAAAVGDNGLGVCGVAYQCGIMPIKIGNASGQFTGSSVAAIALATELGADVISMSFGSYLTSTTLKEVCEYAYLEGVTLVAAAGNDSNWAQIHYPAGIPVCIAVGAVDASDNRASFSNRGVWVDSAAPGVNIHSTRRGGGYTDMEGTSMAAPMVAGAAALLVSEYGDALSVDQVRGLLELTGDPLVGSQWRNDYLTRVNTAGALAATPGEAPIVDITSLIDGQGVSGVMDISCEAGDDGAIERAFLYIDGVLVDELYDPGASFSFAFDVTDAYPGETNVLVEVIDDESIHGFDERSVIVTGSYAAPVPYYENFDDGVAEHWTQYNLSGEAYWHLYEASPGDFTLRLGDPALAPPLYRQRDVDWLYSPLFDLRDTDTARLAFYGDWSFSSSKPMYIYVYNQDSGGFLDVYDSPYGYTYDGWTLWALDSLCGHLVQCFWMLDAANAGGQRWFAIDEFTVSVPSELPLVWFIDPEDGAALSGIKEIELGVYDDYIWQLDRLEFSVDGELHSVTHYPDWNPTLDTTGLPNGPLMLTATVYENDYYDSDGDSSLEDVVSAQCMVYVAHHEVFAFAPASGFYYDEVTITGSGFGAYDEGSCAVTFAGPLGRLSAPVQSWSDNAIVALVPVGAVTGAIAVELNGAPRSTDTAFMVVNPYDDFGFAFENPPENVMYYENFLVRVFAQPDLDRVIVRVAGVPGKEWSLGTAGNPNDLLLEIDISGVTTGEYLLEVEGVRGVYSETRAGIFYLNTLPGDFNSDGVVDDLDTVFLGDYLAVHGEVAAGAAGFLPFLDANADGTVSEGDASFVGYRFGDTLQ